MLTLYVFVAVCFASSTAMAASVLNKPYYEIENADMLFKDFVKQYKKTYNGNEYLERLEIFKETLKDINRRNAQYPQTVFKVNHFADLRPEELQQYRGFKPLNTTVPTVRIPASGVPAPDALDWRQQSAVTHVKNQQNCGSCYIFSAMGSIEGQYAIKHQQCLAFSEGQSLDCLQVGSCDGGWPHEVMQELSQRAGVMLEQDYPYTPSKSTCQENPSKVAAKVQSGQKMDTSDEETLKQNLADIGPLSIVINANDFDSYGGAILRPEKCNGQTPDHAVLLVGYGEEDGTKFWIIKNSWGEGWGESGYVRLLRGVLACGIGNYYTATSTVA